MRSHPDSSTGRTGRNGWYHFRPCSIAPAQSARIQRRAEHEISLEAQLTLLRHRVDQLELRLIALERGPNT